MRKTLGSIAVASIALVAQSSWATGPIDSCTRAGGTNEERLICAQRAIFSSYNAMAEQYARLYKELGVDDHMRLRDEHSEWESTLMSCRMTRSIDGRGDTISTVMKQSECNIKKYDERTNFLKTYKPASQRK